MRTGTSRGRRGKSRAAPFAEGIGAKNREIFRHEEKLFTILSLFIFISVIACSKPKGMVIPERLRKP